MVLQVEVNGTRRTVSSTELFQMAWNGTIAPKTRLWVDGKETTCDNVSGIRFRTASPPGNANAYNSGANNANASNSSAYNSAPEGVLVRTPFVDYKIGGASCPYAICYLDGGRSMFSSSGGRVWMKGAIETQTNAQGGFLKSLGRWASGESFFMSNYVARGPSEIAFATKIPGSIVARQLAQGESIIAQRTAFLAATGGVSMEINFQRKIKTGFFGGEGFIMQRITGPGVVFLELDGSAYEYDLKAGERLTCDTGALAWMDSTCSLQVEMVAGLKNIVFGGEGLFETIVAGPGKVTLQTTSIAKTAGVLAPLIAAALPNRN